MLMKSVARMFSGSKTRQYRCKKRSGNDGGIRLVDMPPPGPRCFARRLVSLSPLSLRLVGLALKIAQSVIELYRKISNIPNFGVNAKYVAGYGTMERTAEKHPAGN